MKKLTIITLISALVGLSKADCWSSAMGYKCCKNCEVYTEDSDGKWGVEDNEWCGIDDNICNPKPINDEPSSCWSTSLGYPCCTGKDVKVEYTDNDGKWGVENGNWCGIIEKKDDNPKNEDEPKNDTPEVEVPQFSMESGFYQEAQGLTLTLNSSGTIYYTLDSSDPTTSSTAIRYNGPIRMYDRSVEENVYSKYQQVDNSPYSISLKNPHIANPSKVDKLTIVRAAIKLADGSFSPVVTKSYVIMNNQKLQYYKDIRVVSLVTDPSNLFDKDKGIYVCGQQYLDWKKSPNYNPNKSEWDSDNIANFFSRGKEWERDASITIFRNGKEEKSQDVGIRIKGASTRNHPVKNFNVFARKKYGESKFKDEVIDNNYSVVDNKPIKKYDSFGLRSVNWLNRMREAIVQNALKDSPILATFDSNRCVLFLDGEFWGLYDITEKASKDYIQANYNIPKEDVALIKNGELEEGTDQDFNDFKNLVNYCSSHDLTQESNYNYVASQIDIESLIYSYASGFYLGIWDWPNRNYLVYRNKGQPIEGNVYSDGKWRFGAFDFDYSAGITYDSFGGVPGYAHDSFTKFQSQKDYFPTPIFSSLIKNRKFYKQFADTMHLMGDEIFSPSKMGSIVEKDKSKHLQYIIQTDWRWHHGVPNISYDQFKSQQNSYFTNGWNEIKEFFERRGQYVYRFMENTYGRI